LSLWRAARSASPYFGFGSYWALTHDFAARFGQWVERPETQRALAAKGVDGPTELYSITVHEPAECVWDLRTAADGTPGSFRTYEPRYIELAAPKLASKGIRWVIWFEGLWEGHLDPQALYLGSEDLKPTRVHG
jgi:hypothetical protein